MKTALLNLSQKIFKYYLLMWERSLDFEESCSRKEYALSILGLIVNGIIFFLLATFTADKVFAFNPLLYKIVIDVIAFSVLFIPPGTLTLRRLKDGGNGTWWLWALLLILLPPTLFFTFLKITTGLYIFFLLCKPTKRKE